MECRRLKCDERFRSACANSTQRVGRPSDHLHSPLRTAASVHSCLDCFGETATQAFPCHAQLVINPEESTVNRVVQFFAMITGSLVCGTYVVDVPLYAPFAVTPLIDVRVAVPAW
jgi:hypothetical protein